METFITEIQIDNSRKLKDFQLNLSNEKPKHLILTGKNGSGKTSLLLEIKKFLTQIDNGNIQHYNNQVKHKEYLEDSLKNLMQNKDKPNYSDEKLSLEKRLKKAQNYFDHYGGTKIRFSNSYEKIFNQAQEGKYLLAFFNSKRHASINVPSGINKIQLKKKYGIQENVNSNFLQHLVNLKADRSFARDDNEDETVEEIDDWFTKLESRLKYIFDVNDLSLKFDRKSYNFDIITDNNEKVNFNTLSDGYSAIISIISELILRMEAHNLKSYDLEGVVLIDEIETHLHVDLQKKILPFLIDFFPKIQFIISTHSPFVLSSINNSIIFDLEKKINTSDFSGYSYDTIIESYFDSNKYSDDLIDKINQYEILQCKNQLNELELEQKIELKSYLNSIPKFVSDELAVKLQQLKLKDIKRHNK